jgi:O-antigen/teichoic acid export membrane protein
MLKPADRTRGVFGNTAALALAQIGAIVLSVVITPYVVGVLGIERYGLWTFLASVVAYASLLQLGVGQATIRFVAFHSERGELDVVRRIVTYGLASHLVLGLLLTPLAWLVGRSLLPHVGLPGPLLKSGETLFPLVLAYFFFAGAARSVGMLLIGLERLWVVSLVTFASQVAYAVTAVVLLSSGAGLYGLLAASVVQTSVQALAFYGIAHRLIGRVIGNPLLLDRRIVRELLRFGGWTQVNTLASLVNATDAIIIGSWVNVGSVGAYGIGRRLAQLVTLIPLTLLPPLLPAAASIHAQGDDRKLARSVLDASRLVGLLSFAVTGFVVAAAPLITTVWLGRSYPDVVGITTLLAVAYLINNLTGVGTTVVTAIGRPRYEAEYAVLGMVLNIVATVLLAPFLGLYGIVGGTVIGIGISSLYFLWRFHRVMALPFSGYFEVWAWRLVAATVPAAAVLFFLSRAVPPTVSEQRGAGLLVLAALAIVYAALVLGGLRAVRFLGAGDLLLIRRILPSRLKPLASLPAVEFLFGVRP